MDPKNLAQLKLRRTIYHLQQIEMKIGGTPRTTIQTQNEDELWRMNFTKKLSIVDEGGNLEVPRGLLLVIYQIGIPAT
jgi:hypothetical protein